MSLDFSPAKWQNVEASYGAWWANRLQRPIVPIRIRDRDPGRPQPSAPLLSQETCADLSIPAADLIDRLDYELSCYHYLGDAFPMVRFDSFGPGLAAAFLGARLDNSTGRVWFYPEQVVPVEELQFRYDPDNIWLRRIRDIYAAGLKRWGDQVLLSIPDLGGSLDVLSTFRPAETLLFDLVDEPEAVKQANWRLHELWHRFYDELSADLRAGAGGNPGSRGWTDWSGTFCKQPAYILQCDFCYMISPAMFDEFVKAELAASAKRLGHAIYHLDGVGQLAHLDSLLEIPDIHAVQWVPGDGKPRQDEWPAVIRKIHAAGKAVLVTCGFEGLAKMAGELGTTKGLCHMPISLVAGEEANARYWLEQFGVD